MDDMKKKESAGLKMPALGRRDLMKMGVSAGVAMAIPAASEAAAQEATPARQTRAAAAPARDMAGPPTGGLQKALNRGTQTWPMIQKNKVVTASTLPGYTLHTGPGWVNNSGRAFGNGQEHAQEQRNEEQKPFPKNIS